MTEDFDTFTVDAEPTAARKAWATAFTRAQGQLLNPRTDKTANTGQYSYSYASLPEVLDLIRPVLHENGLAVMQSVVTHDLGVGVTTRIVHNEGHIEDCGPVLLPAGNTAQAHGSAISYARRYSLLAALGIAADDDDDGAGASKTSGAAATPSPPRRTQPAAAPDPSSSPAPLAGTEGEGSRRNRAEAARGPASVPGASPAGGTSSGGGGKDDFGEGSSTPTPGTLKGHKPGCEFPGATDLKPDGSKMPAGKLRCSGCGVSLNEADVA